MDKIKSQSLHWFFSFNHPFFLKNQTQRISNSSKFLTFFKIIISLSPLCILIKLAETGITISDRSVYKQADLISSKSSCANSRQKKPSQSEHRSCVSRIEKGMYTMYTKGNKSATMAVIRLAELFSIIDFQRNEQRRIVFDSRFDDSRFPNNKRRIPRLVNCAISMSVGSNEVICFGDGSASPPLCGRLVGFSRTKGAIPPPSPLSQQNNVASLQPTKFPISRFR